MNYNQEALKELFHTAQSPSAPEVNTQGQFFDSQMEDNTLVQLPPEQLTDFPAERQPFRPATPERIEELRRDIAQNGLLSPLVVRPMTDGSCQILIGHNRRKAAVLLGMTRLPCIVRYLDDEHALQALISDNLLQREKILPSEKAFAYKQRLDFLNRQGQRTDLTLCQTGTKLSQDILSNETNDSSRQIYRFIRLTHLIRPLLDKVDAQELGLQPGANLSYLTPGSQRLVLRYFFTERKEGTRRLDGRLSRQLRELEESGLLDEDVLLRLTQHPPGSRAPRVVKLPMKAIRDYFPKDAGADEITEKILFALHTVYGDQG